MNASKVNKNNDDQIISFKGKKFNLADPKHKIEFIKNRMKINNMAKKMIGHKLSSYININSLSDLDNENAYKGKQKQAIKDHSNSDISDNDSWDKSEINIKARWKKRINSPNRISQNITILGNLAYHITYLNFGIAKNIKDSTIVIPAPSIRCNSPKNISFSSAVFGQQNK